MTDYRKTFDSIPELYDEIRPDYPEALIDVIIRLSKLKQDAHIVEMGVGTGQITLPFAKRAFQIRGIELGAQLAAFSQEKFSAYPNVTVLNTSFEAWQPEISYDLFLSAQAFHWIEPEFGLAKASSVLKPKGCIALVWHLDRSQETDFFKASTPLFETYVNASQGPNKAQVTPVYLRYKKALYESKLFLEAQEKSWHWQHNYTKDNFIKLLRTFSDTIALESATRQRFYKEMSDLIDDFGGSVTRHHETVLVFAQKNPI